MSEFVKVSQPSRILRRVLAAGAVGAILLAPTACRGFNGESPAGPKPPSTVQNGGSDLVKRIQACYDEVSRRTPYDPSVRTDDPNGYYQQLEACKAKALSGQQN